MRKANPETHQNCRSLLQKAVRRGYVNLVETIVNHLYNVGDKKWLMQRVGVILFEECWPLYSDLELPTSLEDVISTQRQAAQTVKYKDAAGLGSLAYALSQGDNSVISDSAEDQVIKMLATAIKSPTESWQWMYSQCPGDHEFAFIEKAHKSFRKGGWPWDRAFMLAAAHLTVSHGLPSITQSRNTQQSPSDFPFWVALDKHTPQGKKSLSEAAKELRLPRAQVNWTSFYFESAIVNEIAPSPWWNRETNWRLRKVGLTYDDAQSIWIKVRPLIIDSLREDARQLQNHIEISSPRQMKLF